MNAFNDRGLCVASGITKTGKFMEINVANMSDNTQKLLPGMKIGRLFRNRPVILDITDELVGNVNREHQGDDSIVAAAIEHAELKDADIDALIQQSANLSHLDAEQRGKVRNFIRKHQGLFTYGRLVHVPDYEEMEINFNDETPTVSRMYRMTPYEREWLALEI